MLLRRFRYWLNVRRRQRGLREEIALHIEEEVEELQEQGYSDHEARREAARRFGSRKLTTEDARGVWIWPWLESLFHDLRYAVRQWRKHPAFTAIVIATLALGIGLPTAVFSVVDALLLKPLPAVREPGHLVRFIESNEYESVSWTFFERFAERSETTTDVFVADSTRTAWMRSAGAPAEAGRLIAIQRVSARFFETLGARLVLGREFTGEEMARGADVAVASHRFWRDELASDRNAIGDVLIVDETPVRIIGVAPPGFHGPQTGSRPDLWTLRASPSDNAPGLTTLTSMRMLGRLRPGATLDAVEAEAGLIHRQLIDENRLPDRRVHVRSARSGWHEAREEFVEPLTVVALGVLAVLLIACTNVGGMLLARNQRRQHELAVRQSLGGSRSRLVRQLLTECALFVVVGGTLGVLVAFEFTPAVLSSRLLADRLGDIAAAAGPDPRVLGVAAVLAFFSVLLSGLVPAFALSGIDRDSIMRHSRRRISGRATLNKVLVMAQVSIAFVLVVSAGLLLGTLANLGEVEVGFDAARTLVVSPTQAPWARSFRNPMAVPEEIRGLESRLEEISGVTSVAHMVGTGFLLTDSMSAGPLRANPGIPPEEGTQCFYTFVGPGFFETMGITVVGGREFRHGEEAENIGVINRSLAERLFPGVDPVGRNVYDWGAREVVGVVDDTSVESLREEPGCMIYRPSTAGWRWVVATAVDPRFLKEAIVGAVEEFDPTLEVHDIRTFEEVIADTLVRERTVSRVTTAFAAAALLLTAIGLYGTLAYVVAGRTREIGIRMSLGAGPSNVIGMILRATLGVVGMGLVLGSLIALSTTRLLSSLLFGLSPNDVQVFLFGALILLATSLLAVWIPTRRAANVDPVSALKHE